MEMKIISILVSIIKVFLFIFKYLRVDRSIIINIIIAPVSGSKNVSIDGIIVIIINVKKFFFLIISEDNKSIKEVLANSLGCIEKLNILIHALEPLIVLPNINT